MSILNRQITSASKWSAISEIVAKLINPVLTIILARVLTPETFGVVATITMIVSFVEIFTDAGFQKYLIQHEFENEKEKYHCTTVAFWSNLILSFLLWGIIAIFNKSLARLVGSPGLGYVIVISCVSIPLQAFSSIQRALFKREFDFKTLFYVRLVTISIPLFITIPLAFIFKNYWALVLGTIVMNFSNAIILTIKSKWKPNLFYSWKMLKQMLSFSIWTIVESISIWLTNYIDVFIIGMALNEYYLGIYKTSITTVGQIMGLITAATTPVLFSSLSRLQNDRSAFDEIFFKFQKIVGLLIFPIGIGIFCYSDLLTQLLLGNQWFEASGFIGIWALMSTITIVFSVFCSEVYRAIGKPKLSVLSQVLHIIILWPAILVAVHQNFEVLYYTRSLVRFEAIFVDLCIMFFVVKISPMMMLKNVYPSMLSSLCMGGIAWGLLQMGTSIIWSFVSIVFSILIYVLGIMMFPSERSIVLVLKDNIVNKILGKSCLK